MTPPPETTPIREAHRFDQAALARYIQDHVEPFAGEPVVQQFEGGQSNPTFHLTAGDREYVLRKKPPGKLLPSAHAVEREYRVTKALENTNVPVYRNLALCQDESVIGTPFVVMEYIRGRVFRNVELPDSNPEERAALYDQMNDILAKLHSVDPAAVGLDGFGKPGNYYARQISRWSRQYVAAKTDEIPEVESLMEWLPANIPAGDEAGIVHGDYRLENMIIHPTEPRVLAVLDWELSTLGHPLGDLAYNSMPFYSDGGRGGGLLNNNPAETGIPSVDDYVAAYCRRTDRELIEHWNFYMAFSLFRSTSIAQGVYKRGLDGNAASQHALTLGKGIRKLAERAWGLVTVPRA